MISQRCFSSLQATTSGLGDRTASRSMTIYLVTGAGRENRYRADFDEYISNISLNQRSRTNADDSRTREDAPSLLRRRRPNSVLSSPHWSCDRVGLVQHCGSAALLRPVAGVDWLALADLYDPDRTGRSDWGCAPWLARRGDSGANRIGEKKKPGRR